MRATNYRVSASWEILAGFGLGILQLAAASFVGPSFLKEPPSRVDFANETGARIDCSAEGSPPPNISWLSGDGKSVGPIPQTRELLANGSLLFPPFRPSGYRHDVHAATYRCVADNSVGRIHSRDVRVRAVVLQYYEIQVYYNKNVIRGNTALLKCTIPSFVREYITVTSWIQDSKFNIFPTPKGEGKYHMLPSGELLIRHVDDEDKYRSYQCRVLNRLTGATLLSSGRAKFSVSDSPVASAPRPLEKQTSIHVRKGQTAVLPCFAEGNPPPAIRWFRQEHHQLRTLPETDDRIYRVVECLIIQQAEEGDAGRWVCVANNTAGVERMDVVLHVTFPLNVVVQPSKQLTVDVGGKAVLICIVTGTSPHPTATRTWLKDGHVIGPGSESLVIQKVQREDAGMYQCLVRSEDDSAQSSVQLRLGAAQPQLLYKFIHQTMQPGPPVSLKCIATGNPTPHITWHLDGFPLPQNDRFVIGQYVTLHGDVISHVNISNVQVEDGGIYRCTATNRVGEVSHSADMRVYGLPYIRPMPNISAVAGEPLYVACPVAGYPIDSILWQKDGRRLPLNRRQRVFPNGTLLLENVQSDPDRGIYRCTASNKQGRSATQTLPLNVIVPPKISPFAFQMDLHLGNRAGVQCLVTNGDLPLTIEWRKDWGPLDSDVNVQQLGEFTSSLSIESLRPHHAGNYTCLATNSAAQASHSSRLLVNVPPRWISEPRDRNVTRDDSAVFHCQAEGFPAPTQTWRKVIGNLGPGRQPSEYQDLSIHSRGVQIFPNGTLLIHPVSREHQGQYLCEATNGVGAGLSSVVSLVVHVPPEFETKSAQSSVRRGSSQTLQCQAVGDGPMSIEWQREGIRFPSPLQPRYEVKGTSIKGGFLSELHITDTVKPDSGTFTCTAKNPYGRAERIVHLQVQDAPGQPQDLRVVDNSSRRVQLAWLAPRDDRSPVLQYVVQYQEESNSHLSEGWQNVVAGTDLIAVVTGLLPATMYRFRVLAENELGEGEPSEPVMLRTEGETPTGEPQAVAVTATASDSLRVTWTAPLQHLWNGEILGYYVGYREHGSGRPSGYNFTTVKAISSGSGVAFLTDLKKYRKYGVVIQAFNEKGPGPMSAEIVAQTLEDVPTAPPLEIKCQPRSSQSIALTWQPPPQLFQNGRIQGYKVYYENVDEWPPGHIEAESKVTSDTSTEIHGLQKHANYSIQVWAYTHVGDGVMSNPIYCITDEAAPEPPRKIKVVASSPTSLTVSWLKPLRSNGQLTSYGVYWRVLKAGQERDLMKRHIPPMNTHYEVHDLHKGEAYEFWVTASTQVGEGQSTPVVYATINNRVAAGIISFGETISVRRRGSVLLPCLAVGIPPPERTWFSTEGKPIMGDPFHLQTNGSLHISDIQRQQQGNYSCSVNNAHGSDEISYFLRVLVPPSAPVLRVAARGSTWLQIQWSNVENGGSAVRGFLLNFRREDGGEWEERSLPRDATFYRLHSLSCGTEYQLKLMAYNSVGSGSPSPTLTSRTDGAEPLKPSYSEFLESNPSNVTLHLKTWADNGCPITSFSIEYRETVQEDWLTVGSNVQNKDSFTIAGLWPGMRYMLRVTATNSAGTTVAEYTVTTLPLIGGTLGPELVLVESDQAVPAYLDVAVLLPLTISLLALVALSAGVYICLRRKPNQGPDHESDGGLGLGHGRGDAGHDTQAMVALDNKQNLAQREQYYAAVQKGIATHTVERVPEYAEDISPYATFHVQGQGQGQQMSSSPGHMQTFVYHDHRLAAMETMQLKSSNLHDDYTKLRAHQKNKRLRSENSDYSGSVDCKSELGPMPRPTSRGERISLQTLLYPGAEGPGGGPESSTSPEQSPVPDRRNPTRRHRHNVR
ncbi:Down syndrome cell adhesion molecule-like protein Dscam2 isoform X4 [Zootermopsis nevadensis]|nr:Down syndrome cell adhesion molecule-like protein Dscam2 isoform X4 [Zootermopsis nevadensis]